MSLATKVQDTLERLNPRFDDLADGYADLLGVDEDKGRVKVKLIGGRLH
jgi:hypothetical protein